MRRHADALTADFRRYYHARVRDFGALEAADLAANLPRESASAKRLHPEAAWGDEAYLLWSIEYHVRAIAYSFTEDAKTGANSPVPLPNPARQAENRSLFEAADFETVAAALRIDLEGGASDG